MPLELCARFCAMVPCVRTISCQILCQWCLCPGVLVPDFVLWYLVFEQSQASFFASGVCGWRYLNVSERSHVRLCANGVLCQRGLVPNIDVLNWLPWQSLLTKLNILL